MAEPSRFRESSVSDLNVLAFLASLLGQLLLIFVNFMTSFLQSTDHVMIILGSFNVYSYPTSLLLRIMNFKRRNLLCFCKLSIYL